MLCSRCKLNERLNYHSYCRECVNAYGREKRRERGLKPNHKNFTHGCTYTPEYKVWDSMKQRCLNPNNSKYRLYGGRGITICERWLDFANFKTDMGPRPTSQHTIDRLDNDKGYELTNCRWATKKEQARNMRVNKRYLFNDAFLTISEWSERTEIDKSTLYYRLERYGWSVERALTESTTLPYQFRTKSH